ncbi:hypothetical protein IscW_ISCW018445 [Ixodes scapularis]|uniref:Uncharacterized protein n=1 Tax=Ixodes scapularis TaxID=6945 RepID=B7PKI3_IXOSC|nr:hypothetical protein IscW_ISCW018445 [Ixodes scapularis]|eukprot:XP_002400340.1 hypothetical protein IscW_ISCW018445 [Ixodes scapularis]
MTAVEARARGDPRSGRRSGARVGEAASRHKCAGGRLLEARPGAAAKTDGPRVNDSATAVQAPPASPVAVQL